jgi:hypothetical protein
MRLEEQSNPAAAKILWDEVFSIHTDYSVG